MNTQPSILVVSSSHDPASRSEKLALLCKEQLLPHSNVTFISLKEFAMTGYDLNDPLKSQSYLKLHALVSASDGLVLASPVYNWACCAELKRFIELVGTTPPDQSVKSAFFDKILAFVNAGGGGFSYTAFTGLASSMMLDFKCIVSPYNIYAENRDWDGENVSPRIQARIEKSMQVFLNLVTLLEKRTYTSGWEI